MEGAGLVLWAGSPYSASFGFCLREPFQSQTHKEKILLCRWPSFIWQN